MHGLSGFKEQRTIRTLAEAFLAKGLTVVTFDVANTIGESEGRMEDATLTSYYEDLQDIIHWSSTQLWFQKPFVLCGHSFGGYCVTKYTEEYPEMVRGLVPVSPVVSGALSKETLTQEEIDRWQTTGWKEKVSQSKPGVIVRTPWTELENRLGHDLLPAVAQITMPTLVIVGENDTSTPPKHVQQLFDALSCRKEMRIIRDAPHTFREETHLKEIQQLIVGWVDAL